MTRALPSIPLSLVLAGALAVAGCGGDDNNTGATKPAPASGGAATKFNNHGTKTVGDEVELELDDYYFEPTVLRGKPGQTVELELENEGKVEHNFSLASQGIDKDVEEGEKTDVVVHLPKSGTLAFVCKYHESRGMRGQLTTTRGGSSSGGTSSSSGSKSDY